MTDETLFPGYEPPPTQPPEPKPDLSPDQRRTLRQAADIANGRHPLTRGPLHPQASRNRDRTSPKNDPYTCGSCYFRELVGGPHDGRFPKCCLPAPHVGADASTRTLYPRISYSAATDVRAWWPACPSYSPSDPISPDAARSIPGTGEDT